MTASSVTSSSGAIQFTGLASGLDTSSIISQLMSVESQPQTALKSRVAAEQAQVSALQSINSAVAALSTAAQSFESGSTWTQLAATSSNSTISVTASSSAVPSTFNVSVTSTAAAAQTYLSASAIAANTQITIAGADGSTLTDASGNPLTIDTGDGQLSTVASAINATTTASKLRATVIHADSGDVLMLTSTATGTNSNFSLQSAAGTVAAATNGTNAVITVNNQTVSSQTNTFTNVVDGVTLTLGSSSGGATSTIAVTDDGSSRANGINLFVQQINSLLQSIASTTAYGTITAGQAATGGGALPGNSDLRSVAAQLVNTIFPPDGTSIADYGLDVDSDGNLTFDQSKFEAAYQANPDQVQAAFIGKATTNPDGTTTGMDGFVTRVQQIADLASDSYTGTLTTTINSMNDEINDYNTQISDWDDRLALKQAALEKQYSDLETSLSTMQSQQSWLSSQISSLDGGWAQNSSSGS